MIMIAFVNGFVNGFVDDFVDDFVNAFLFKIGCIFKGNVRI